MENYLSVILAIFEHLKLLTEDEAKKLLEDLRESTLPGGYESASKLVEDIFSKHEVQDVVLKLKSLK
jgi:hypothetical protein